MARRGVKCGDLAKLLAARGCRASAQSVRSKMSRGTFSASFLLQALDAMGCQQVDLGGLGAPAGHSVPTNAGEPPKLVG